MHLSSVGATFFVWVYGGGEVNSVTVDHPYVRVISYLLGFLVLLIDQLCNRVTQEYRLMKGSMGGFVSKCS